MFLPPQKYVYVMSVLLLIEIWKYEDDVTVSDIIFILSFINKNYPLG
jgi:hypothetical protein